MIRSLVAGNKKFKNSKFIKLASTFDDLVKFGQKPKVLFIGCSDSRVVPDLIVDAKPGDMFILRNVGNFVPPFKDDDDFHGSFAAIEYAVSVLDVKDIIICGHSFCGACASLYENLDDKPHLFHVKKWLELGEKAKNSALEKCDDTSDKEKLFRLTEKESIKFQLKNLVTYPEIRKRLEDDRLKIHGWYYKIEDGSIEYYDENDNSFKLFD